MWSIKLHFFLLIIQSLPAEWHHKTLPSMWSLPSQGELTSSEEGETSSKSDSTIVLLSNELLTAREKKKGNMVSRMQETVRKESKFQLLNNFLTLSSCMPPLCSSKVSHKCFRETQKPQSSITHKMEKERVKWNITQTQLGLYFEFMVKKKPTKNQTDNVTFHSFPIFF